MTIYPAIDLLGGQCVRLARGSFEAVTVYADDPVEQARDFQAEGATALHVVDLDGARDGRPVHTSEIASIRSAFDGFVQSGGGLRDTADVQARLELGVDRVILGTAAVSRPDWVGEMVDRFGPARIAASVDLRGRRIMLDGWLRSAEEGTHAVLSRLRDAGLRTVVFTDTDRDGLLGSVDATRAADFVEVGFETIVAGGVTDAGDVRRLASVGASGAIVGSALYERRLTVAEARAAAGGST